jgi:hydrogenase-4 component F
LFGAPSPDAAPSHASYVPLFIHLLLVAIAGVFLPGPLVTWFQSVARLLG